MNSILEVGRIKINHMTRTTNQILVKILQKMNRKIENASEKLDEKADIDLSSAAVTSDVTGNERLDIRLETPQGMDSSENKDLDICEEVEDSDNEDVVEDLSSVNREFKPFRNEESLTHKNLHLHEQSARYRTESTSTTASSSTIDPNVVREKVRRQMKKKADIQMARRIRKSGESSLMTRKKRETQNDIKQSMSADWF